MGAPRLYRHAIQPALDTDVKEFDMMGRYVLIVLLVLMGLVGIVTFWLNRSSLPDGYYLRQLERGKTYLHSPDGLVAYGGLAMQVYYGPREILLVASQARLGGQAEDPSERSENGCVALLISTDTQVTRKLSMREAAQRSQSLIQIESSSECRLDMLQPRDIRGHKT